MPHSGCLDRIAHSFEFRFTEAMFAASRGSEPAEHIAGYGLEPVRHCRWADEMVGRTLVEEAD